MSDVAWMDRGGIRYERWAGAGEAGVILFFWYADEPSARVALPERQVLDAIDPTAMIVLALRARTEAAKGES